MRNLLLNKQAIEMISRAVRLGSKEVAMGDVWSKIHSLHGIGRAYGRILVLDIKDRKALRQMVISSAGWDPHTDGSKVKGSRSELAGKTRNEKLSGETVAKSIVLVAVPGGTLTLGQQVQQIMPGCAMAMPTSLLEGLPCIIVVENLEVMLQAHRYCLPDELAGVPFVFRGSPQFSPAPVAALATIVPRVIYFPDTDPQGLANSLGAPNCSGILSCEPDAFQALSDAGLDKPQDYTKQQHLMPSLLADGHPLVSVIETFKAGFSQESMMGKGIRVWGI